VFIALLSLTALIVPERRVAAQSRNERAVRAVVDSFFAAVQREQWDSAATFIDLPRFEPFLKAQVSSARSALPVPPVTAEQFMASDSTMPRAVAEWEAARSNRFHTAYRFDDYSSQFAGVTSQHMLFSLTLPDAAARWIAARDERVILREMRRRAGCLLGDLLAAPPMVTRSIVAIAFRDDSTALVIVTDDRFKDDSFIGGERIAPVHRTAAGWRIEPRDDLLNPRSMGFGLSECPKK
jgi:hypothetical protein